MKYALFGDVHDRDLGELEKALDFHKINSIVCTGDFDSVRSIRQFMELEEKYLSEGKSVHIVPGNHDYALLRNEPLVSKQLKMQGKEIKDYYNELLNNPEIYAYLDNLASEYSLSKTGRKIFYLDENNLGKNYRTVVVHGGYSGSLSSYLNCPEGLMELWFRINPKYEEDYLKNFEIMKEKGDKIMIRGHDHYALYASYSESLGKIIKNMPQLHGTDYLLKPDRLHIINPGALVDGFYAILDTEEDKFPVLKYYNL
ncbi:MAG TPA: metallophosphoesterase [Alphaproteobacteria bacterium]|nr:metallophosphoesterase [Alphaproteobacteria bacterium]